MQRISVHHYYVLETSYGYRAMCDDGHREEPASLSYAVQAPVRDTLAEAQEDAETAYHACEVEALEGAPVVPELAAPRSAR